MVRRLIRNIRHGRMQKLLAAATALSAPPLAFEIYLEHYKASFGDRWMWTPIYLTPPLTAAGIAGFVSPKAARTVLPFFGALYALDGLIGVYTHFAGIRKRPGGFGELLQSFHQNGMGSQVQQWSSGQTQAADPSQVQQGLVGSGIVEAIAQRTGLPAATVQSVLSKAVPVLMHHLVSNGHVTPEGQATGNAVSGEGILQSVLSRI